MSTYSLSRREFIITSTLALTLGTRRASAVPAQPLRFGVCADVHQDIMHDAEERLQTFVTAMNEAKVHFIVQLGDFCHPKPANQRFMDILRSFSGPHYHVPGNHDIDGGFSWEEMRAFYAMPAQHYSYDVGACHFVVLDGNEKTNPPQEGYPRYIGQEQLNWLKRDLDAAEGLCIVFSHQALHHTAGASVENYPEIQKILEDANKMAGYAKVAACIYGHRHIDEHKEINGIHYLSVNSMSNQWLGKDYIHQRFDEATEEAHPWVRYTAPYRDPLYAIVTIHPEGKLLVEGKQSEFIPPAPEALGHPGKDSSGAKVTPVISDREMLFQTKQNTG